MPYIELKTLRTERKSRECYVYAIKTLTAYLMLIGGVAATILLLFTGSFFRLATDPRRPTQTIASLQSTEDLTLKALYTFMLLHALDGYKPLLMSVAVCARPVESLLRRVVRNAKFHRVNLRKI